MNSTVIDASGEEELTLSQQEKVTCAVCGKQGHWVVQMMVDGENFDWVCPQCEKEMDDEDDEPTAAELILSGVLCQVCGSWMDDVSDPDFEEPGHPRTCDECK